MYSGRVRVLGQAEAAEHPDEPVTVDGLVLQVDGQDWPWCDKAVVMLHKPAGYECSLKPKHHPGVMSLLPLPLRNRGLQPIGRLDEDTTGLLLLTDDGELNHRLTSPRWHAPKTYVVGCRHAVQAQALSQLLAGVVLDDDPDPVAALAVEQVSPTTLHLTLGEGRYHQVKRMVAAVGNRVETLHRLSMGPQRLEEQLGAGKWRWLSADEIQALRGLSKSA